MQHSFNAQELTMFMSIRNTPLCHYLRLKEYFKQLENTSNLPMIPNGSKSSGMQVQNQTFIQRLAVQQMTTIPSSATPKSPTFPIIIREVVNSPDKYCILTNYLQRSRLPDNSHILPSFGVCNMIQPAIRLRQHKHNLTAKIFNQ